MRLFLPALLPLLALAACEQVVDVPEPAHTPALVVRYTLPGTPAPDTLWPEQAAWQQLFISTSQRLFDQRPLSGRADATARLLADDGTVVEEFRSARPYVPYFGQDTTGFYRPTRGFVGQPGATYRLQVSAPGVADVESRLTLPPAAPVVTAAAFAPSGAPGDYSVKGRLLLTVQDDGATADYYLATARLLDAQGQPVLNGYVSQNYDDPNNSSDTDFNGGRFQLSYASADGSGLYPYADNQVSGKAFQLAAELQLGAFDPITGQPLRTGLLEVSVARVTRDFYEHYLSRRRYYDVNGNPFAEPAPLYANIRGGYGLFGGLVETRTRVAF